MTPPLFFFSLFLLARPGALPAAPNFLAKVFFCLRRSLGRSMASNSLDTPIFFFLRFFLFH